MLDRVIDTVTALAFTFFLLALIGSGLLELIAGFFRWRATYLARTVEVLLGARDAFGWQGGRDWIAAHTRRAQNPAPSFGAHKALAAIRTRIASHPLTGGTVATPPSFIRPIAFADALLAAIGRDQPPASIAAARLAIASLPEGSLRASLQTLALESHDLHALRTRIAAWYDDAMEQTRALYRQTTQMAMFAMATVLTLVFDVDALRLARTIWGAPLPFGWPGIHIAAPLPGLALTILAVSLGAPFWFDLMRNVASLRGGNASPDPEAPRALEGRAAPDAVNASGREPPAR